MAEAIRDQNHVTVALGQSNTSSVTPLPFLIDSLTGRLLVDSSGGAGSVLTPTGTVDGSNTSFSVPAGTTITSVVVDGLERYSGFGYTYNSVTGVITIDPLAPPVEYIRVNTATVTAAGQVNSVIAGTGISVNSNDSRNPIITNTGLVSTTGQYKIFVTVGATNADYLISNYIDAGDAINHAYADLPSTGGIIFVLDGNFSYSTPIVINTAQKFVLLQGAPAGATTLTYTGTGTSVAITYNVSKAITSGHGIRDIKLVGPSSSGQTVGIQVGGMGADDSKGFAGGLIRDVHIRGFGLGFLTGNNVFIITLENVVINFCGKLLFEKGGAGAGATNWTVNGANTINSGENMRYIGCAFADSSSGSGSIASQAVEVQISGLTDSNFIACSFDDAQLYVNKFGGIGNEVHVTDCHFENPAQNSISAYTFISCIANQANNTLVVSNTTFDQDASTSVPTEFIKVGNPTVLHGCTFDLLTFASAGTVTRCVTFQDSTTVDNLTWDGIVNNNTAFTSMVGTLPYTTSGSADGTGAYSSVSTAGLFIARSSNTVLDASTFAGADMFAKIQAAYDSVTTSVPCSVYITVPSGVFSGNTNVNFATNGKRVKLFGNGGGGQGTELRFTGTGNAFTYNTGIQSGSPFISHSTGYGMYYIKLTGNNVTDTTTQVGLYCGGTNGAAGMIVESCEIFGFGTGLETGANTYNFSVYNTVIRNNARNVFINSASNSGEGMHFTNCFIVDVANNTPTNGFQVADFGAASLIITGGSIDDCQLALGLQIACTMTGVHMENPSSAWGSYTYITVADSSFSTLCLTGCVLMNDQSGAAKPTNFISSNGATVDLNGVTFFSNSGGTITNACVGGRFIWNGITNANSCITNIASGIPYTYSGSNQTFSLSSMQLRATAFSGVPSSPLEGMVVAVTDSTTATWGATITGTGSNHVLAYYDGTNWTVMGK